MGTRVTRVDKRGSTSTTSKPTPKKDAAPSGDPIQQARKRLGG